MTIFCTTYISYGRDRHEQTHPPPCTVIAVHVLRQGRVQIAAVSAGVLLVSRPLTFSGGPWVVDQYGVASSIESASTGADRVAGHHGDAHPHAVCLSAVAAVAAPPVGRDSNPATTEAYVRGGGGGARCGCQSSRNPACALQIRFITQEIGTAVNVTTNGATLALGRAGHYLIPHSPAFAPRFLTDC